MNYRVKPGLYGVGLPDKDSPVFVTANYKMSFDRLRMHCDDINAWILVLDTKGINVWCAAGKGTFGANELVNRIRAVNLKKIVSHRTLVLPQLGAVGVAAHQVKNETGFKIKYGPVLARDLPAYLENGQKASMQMRTVSFGLKERAALIPMELIPAIKWSPLIFVALLLIQWARTGTLDLSTISEPGKFVLAFIAGIALIPIFLPWIPFRSFALKGLLMGAIIAGFISLTSNSFSSNFPGTLLLMTPLISFFALNFTGSTTFTSISGVKKELLTAIPLIIVSIISGIAYRVFF
jgi:hypothetical protein